jgi:hypothetical protein
VAPCGMKTSQVGPRDLVQRGPYVGTPRISVL